MPRTTKPTSWSIIRCMVSAATVLVVMLLLPAVSAAATLHKPDAGAHLPWNTTRPMAQFDPATGESPRWILLATDAEMQHTVRYCRMFVWALDNGTRHWGCNAWAIGTDIYGRDVVRNLEWGKIYYWQVVSSTTPAGSDGEKVDVKSAVRAFAIDDMPKSQSVSDISNSIFDSVYGDGTNLNLGAAAFSNSGVRVKRAASMRRGTWTFRIGVEYSGKVDLRRSYIRVQSRAGTRYVKVVHQRNGLAVAMWTLNANERRLATKRFSYQAFIKSSKNGALVRSPAKVLVIRSVPRWKRSK